MVEKDSLKSPKSFSLTNSEKEVLHLFSDEFLTIKQIAKRRKCSLQAVYKIIKSLKKKGEIDRGLNKVEKIHSTFNQTDVRLHGQEFNIHLIWQEPKYQTLLEKSNFMSLDGNSIRLYKNSIEIYSGQSFFGKEVNEAEGKSLDYWYRFFNRLSEDLGVCLIKPRSRNIKIVNQHYARGDSEISDNATQNRQRIWIYAQEDGKLAYITDDSFGLREDEAVHPITAKPDRKAIDKQVNDWRLNNPPTNSEIAKKQEDLGQGLKVLTENVSILVELQKDVPKNMSLLAQQISSHLKLIQEYRSENVKWRKGTIKEIKDEIKHGKQTRLFEFKI
jgi:DNA-binding CsgD family transcriptional regulator